MIISVADHLLCVLLGQKDPFSHSKVHLFILKLNFTGKEGVLSLTAALGGKSPLRTLYVQGQSVTLTEPHMVEVCSKLATCLGTSIFIIPPAYEVYRGYIVFAFSVRVRSAHLSPGYPTG